MTKIWYPTALVAHPITGKPRNLLVKVLLLLCAAVAVSNSALAQTPVCPDPWATAKSVYATMLLTNVSHSASNGQTINQTASFKAKLFTLQQASCTWEGSEVSPATSLNDALTFDCKNADGQTQKVTDTWVSTGTDTVDIKLQFLTKNTYQFGIGAVVTGTVTLFADNCTSLSVSNTGILVGPKSNSAGLFYSGPFSSDSAAVLAGKSTFSAVPYDLASTVPDRSAQPVTWDLTWNFSPVPDDTIDDACKSKGSSELGCQNQSLGENIPISGTPFNLHYQSDRQLGRAGADAVAISDAQGLDGWTLSAHHVLEPQALTLFCIDGSCTPASLQPKALYLGDGQMRSAAKIQAPVRLNGKIYLTSEDGGEIYVFDGSFGRHLQTLHPLTGAVLYNFGYDSAGELVSVTDAYGNLTKILRDAKEHPTAIVSPYGQMTSLAFDSNGYLNRITDPASKSVLLVNSPTGLLTSMTDANGNTSHYRYDPLGRLVQDFDPARGFTTLTRTNNSQGYQVIKATALGTTNTYQTSFSSEAGTSSTQEFTNIAPCGVKATSSETQAKNLLSESASLPDGTSSSTTVGPDPRWGIQVPVPTGTTLTLGNLTENTSHKRTASLGTAGNPFSLTTQTDTDTVNGRVYTSIFTASNRTYTNTSPVGRRQLVTLDAKEQIATTQVEGLLPTQFTYDDRGRLASSTQGARNTTLTYDADGRVASIIDPLKFKRSFTYDPDGRLLTMTFPDGRIINHSYDANSNLTAVTPPGKPAHDFSLNSINLPSVYSPPAIVGTGHTTYAYDADRRLSLITRPDGEQIKYNYDHAGRLSSLVTPTETLNYGYSATTCNLISAGVPGGEQLTYGYNGPLLTTTSWTGTVAGNVSRVYNNNFWITSENIVGGTAVSFTYDNDGLLDKAGALTLNRTPTNGLITGTTLGAASDARTYNSFGELTGYTASDKGTPVYTMTGRQPPGPVRQLTEARFFRVFFGPQGS